MPEISGPGRSSRTQEELARERFAEERQRQVLALLLLAALVLAGTVLHAGLHNVFPHGWWRLL